MAVRSITKDLRPYIRVPHYVAMTPQMDAVDDPATQWTYFVSVCYTAENRTGGEIPMNIVIDTARTDRTVAAALLTNDLWHLPGHACSDCAQPRPGYAIVHDLFGDGLRLRVPKQQRPKIPQEVRDAVFARDGHVCQECGATEDLALDHIYPWSRGGPDTEDNLRVLCRSCNLRKGARV